MRKLSAALLLSLCLAGCATMPACMDRARQADALADRAGFEKERLRAGDFTLFTCRRTEGPASSLRIYVEGDGRAWETKTRLSDDPTPAHPVALALAAQDSATAVAYIARPGQYPQHAAECDPTYWSARRFSPEVVRSLNDAIDLMKKRSGALRVELIGYSGGATLVLLVAAVRDDVDAIRTVAGNLDPNGLCAYHHVSQLTGSLDPLEHAARIATIPQRHFIAEHDTIVPAVIAETFAKRIGDGGRESITVVPGTTHHAGWERAWPALLEKEVYRKEGKGD